MEKSWLVSTWGSSRASKCGISSVLHMELICPASERLRGPKTAATPRPAWLHAVKVNDAVKGADSMVFVFVVVLGVVD